MGVPDKGRPSPIDVPFIEMLEGVAEDSVAFPPDIDKEKSETSKLPLPELVLKTDSSNVTETIELLVAI